MIFTDAAEGHAWVSAASCYTKEAGCERPMLHEPEHVKVCVGGKQVGSRGWGWEAGMTARGTAELGVDRDALYLDYAGRGGGKTHKVL